MSLKHAMAAGALLVCASGTVLGEPAGPPADFKIVSDYTLTSPDGATTVEQYAKAQDDGSRSWQFWAQRKDVSTKLAPDQDDYPAGFRFTPDSHWLVRMQKTGAGYADLYLYRLGPQGFAAATAKPLSDLAWTYFRKHPDSRKIPKPNLHISANLVQGADGNYRSIGENWPDSRYIVVSLWGDLDSNAHHPQLLVLRGWRCRYDLQTGKFDVPADFVAHNAEAIARQRQ